MSAKAIVWYQYQDTGTRLAELAAKLSNILESRPYDPQTVCPADWGLVDGNREPKCTTAAYDFGHCNPLISMM